jgi:hypothetical protein
MCHGDRRGGWVFGIDVSGELVGVGDGVASTGRWLGLVVFDMVSVLWCAGLFFCTRKGEIRRGVFLCYQLGEESSSMRLPAMARDSAISVP